MDRDGLIKEITEVGGSWRQVVEILENAFWDSERHGQDHDDQVFDAHMIGYLVGKFDGNPTAMVDALIEEIESYDDVDDEDDENDYFE